MVLASSPEQSEVQLSEQPQLYREALELISQGRWKSLPEKRQQLAGYPLYPYLVYADLMANLRYSRRAEVARYLSDYQGTVKAQHLRSKWLDYLARRNYWTTYIEYYSPEQASVKQQCLLQLARLNRLDKIPDPDQRAAQKESALSSALALWNVGKSQPKECDKLFSLLVTEKRISEEIAWQRFNKALLNRQTVLARYLKRYLKNKSYSELAQRYYRVDRNPREIEQFSKFKLHNPEETAIIGHGLVRLARKNSHAALKAWSHYQQTHQFNDSARSQIVTAIIKGLYQQEFPKIADSYFLDHLQLLDQTSGGALTEWRIRQALGEKDWPAVQTWIGHLPRASREKSVWRYWAIRSMEGNPSTTGSPIVEEMTAKLASERDYYGFLASERLNREYSLNHNPVAIDEQRIESIKQLPAMQRARELVYHRDYVDANREWNQASDNFNRSDWLAASIVASQWRWHNKAIASLGQAKYWDDIEIRFPLAYLDLFNLSAEKIGIHNYKLLALARQESAFDPTATSSAGAMGLMQLMPATAKATARKHNLAYRARRELHNPETNIPIASHYYQMLLDRYDNSPILASAAYNAGPRRVDQWLAKSGGKLPFDIWVELIPFRETRSYVRNTLMYSIIYSRQLGLSPPMLHRDEKLRLL